MGSPVDSFLIVEPSQELRFKGPFHSDVSTTGLKITNTSAKKITFKIKTTAPKRYCVRPNQGVIESQGYVHVSVMLQPFDYDPTEKNKHKFMVQTMFLPTDEDVDLEALWKNASPDSVMTSNKMRCVFEMPDTATETAFETPLPPSQPAKKTDSDDLRRLKDEISSLRGENLQLKEESVRLRRTRATTDHGAPSSVAAATGGGGMAPADPMMYYVMALAALIFGIIFGKLFF